MTNSIVPHLVPQRQRFTAVTFGVAFDVLATPLQMRCYTARLIRLAEQLHAGLGPVCTCGVATWRANVTADITGGRLVVTHRDCGETMPPVEVSTVEHPHFMAAVAVGRYDLPVSVFELVGVRYAD